MKIKTRRHPANFQSLNENEPAAAPALAEDAAAPEDPPVEAEVLDAAPTSVAPAPAAEAPAPPQARSAPYLKPSTSLSPGPSGAPIWGLAALISGLWVCAPVAFAIGYQGGVAPFQENTFALTIFVLMAVGPAAMIWVAAFMLRQGQLLAAEARRTRIATDEMLAPALLAAGRTGDVLQMVRAEIARTGEEAHDAYETLLGLRHALAAETDRLGDAAMGSARAAQALTETLSNERAGMAGLASTLDSQAAAVAQVITRQAQMVAEASDLAETQLREAEALLAARAADLTAAAGEAGDAARTAGEDLTRHIARLEAAGLGVAEQIGAVEQGLAEQRAALTTVAHGLRADHETFAAEAETQGAQLSEVAARARDAAVELSESVAQGGRGLSEMIDSAAEKFRQFATTTQAEHQALGDAGRRSMDALALSAAEARADIETRAREAGEALAASAEAARAAAEQHVTAARERIDQLSEAAFSAGQRANQAFEARLDEARALVEQSAKLVEEAGAAAAQRLDHGTAAVRAALDELQRMLGEVDDRSAHLPAAARRQADEVRSAVTESIDELMAQARRTADETAAIDTAFQDRVRRNYEMLSEAVRLMGSVAGAPPPPPPRERPAKAAAKPEPARDALEPPLLEPARPAGKAAGRLRLTPTATDEEFASVFEAAGGRTDEPTGDGWTWKELLSSIDDADGAAAEGRREEALFSEIVGMGIDPAALLPRSKVEEIAAALQTGDVAGAREVVRKLAPAGIRRLTRRLFTDEAFKPQAVKHVERYQGLLADAAKRDGGGYAVADLLASDGGRAFLLLDAASGDVG